jgi:aryl-alcohol dehydrogenase-like predicted oxidoreductase
MNFGWVTNEAESLAIMDRALELGINFWDTTDIYGKGASEELIGRWFSQVSARRERIVLATKLYIDMDEWPNFGGLSAVNIRRACEASLRPLED